MPTDTKTTYRLSPETYNALAKQCPSPGVGPATTELQAGFQLGVQYVLQKLREGYVAGEDYK